MSGQDILNPEHELWEVFCERLFGAGYLNFRVESGSNRWDCECVPNMTMARKLLSEMHGIDAEKTILFFRDNEANCDCGVLFNVEAFYFSRIFKDSILYPFESVLRFSDEENGIDTRIGLYIHSIENSPKVVEIASLIDPVKLSDAKATAIAEYLISDGKIKPQDLILILQELHKDRFYIITFAPGEGDNIEIAGRKSVSREEIEHLISLTRAGAENVNK